MKYHAILKENECRLDVFSNFICRDCRKDGLIMIEFDDSDAAEIFGILKDSVDSSKIKSVTDLRCNAYGEDNAEYCLTEKGVEKSEDDCFVDYSLKKVFRFQHKMCKKNKKSERCCKRYLRAFPTAETARNLITLPNYQAHHFFNHKRGLYFPYRVRKSKNKNRPLVVYLHGGQSVGSDNFKQLAEFIRESKELREKDCNILLPQAPYNCWMESENYVFAVKDLIDIIAESVNADKNRIYVYGGSFGGHCTWRMAWNFADYFACAMPVIGANPYVTGNCDEDFGRIKNLPLWVAHSEDDEIVPVKNDDYCVEQLRKIDGNVKYTRWNGFGHGMWRKFYKTENWVDWMFAQSLEKR